MRFTRRPFSPSQKVIRHITKLKIMPSLLQFLSFHHFFFLFPFFPQFLFLPFFLSFHLLLFLFFFLSTSFSFFFPFFPRPLFLSFLLFFFLSFFLLKYSYLSLIFPPSSYNLRLFLFLCYSLPRHSLIYSFICLFFIFITEFHSMFH